MTIASITAAATSADARPKHRHAQAPQAQVTCDQRGCSDSPTAVAARKMTQRPERGAPEGTTISAGTDSAAAVSSSTARSSATRNAAYTARAEARRQTQVDANGNSVVLGGRPSGCPHRFCGCEASLYVFGEIRKDLNLAANWVRKFPRTQAAPGMVAARSGHVFVLMSHVEGNQWLVHDGNSGGGKTRRHVRSIAGYAIVDPHASRVASN